MLSSTNRKKASKQKSYVCPACKKLAFSSIVGLNVHMTSGFCPMIHSSAHNKNISLLDDGGVDIQLLQIDQLHPLNKKSIQENIPQFGSCSTKSIRTTINEMKNQENVMFPDVIPRQPISHHHLNLYNHPSIDMIYERSNAEIAELSSCFDVNDEEVDGNNSVQLQSHTKSRIPVSRTDDINLSSSTVAQIHLANILGKHKCDMALFDEVTNWVKHHSLHNEVDWKYGELKSRKGLVSSIERTMKTENLKPKNTDVFSKFLSNKYFCSCI